MGLSLPLWDFLCSRLSEALSQSQGRLPSGQVHSAGSVGAGWGRVT